MFPSFRFNTCIDIALSHMDVWLWAMDIGFQKLFIYYEKTYQITIKQKVVIIFHALYIYRASCTIFSRISHRSKLWVTAVNVLSSIRISTSSTLLTGQSLQRGTWFVHFLNLSRFFLPFKCMDSFSDENVMNAIHRHTCGCMVIRTIEEYFAHN